MAKQDLYLKTHFVGLKTFKKLILDYQLRQQLALQAQEQI